MNTYKRELVWVVAGSFALSAAAVPPQREQMPVPAVVTNAGNTSLTNQVPGPHILFGNPIYDFGRIKAGDPVKATFVFTNVGDERLIISAVTPGCGCTTAGEWTRQAEPGESGKIPIQFTSTGFGGQVSKLVTVVSNDKLHPTTTLQIKGTIWRPVDVVPQYAVLNVVPDSSGATTTIAITNNTEEPLTLSAPEVSNPAFQAELRTNEVGKTFQLVVSTSANKVGSAQGQITLRTSSTNVPVVTITAWANVQPAINVIPPNINLPPAPLPNRHTPIITLINNTTNPVTFSEASVSLQGVDLQTRELQAGRYFTATLAFPPGFELPQGQTAEFTVKSSHPKYPLIKVPITQTPRSIAAAGQPVTVAPKPASATGMATPAAARQPRILPRPATATVQPPMPPMPPLPDTPKKN